MSDASLPPRKSIREFFDYRIDYTPIVKRRIAGRWIVVGTALGAVAFGGVVERIEAAVPGGIIGLVASLILDRLIATVQVAGARRARRKKEEELGRLAEETRTIQATDVIKTFLREFERTQIDRNDLTILEEVYLVPEGQTGFFERETLEQKIGDLINKSVLLVSKGDFRDPDTRLIYWEADNQTESFFNPVRLIAVFLTRTQLVICEAQIDSIDGDLSEDIARIALPDIVSITFHSERMRLPLDKETALQTAFDLGWKPDEMKEIEKSFGAKGNGADWVLEEMVSSLQVTRSDAVALSVPIRTDHRFGKHVSALDQTKLTDEEIAVDRIVNELNRLVQNAKSSLRDSEASA